MRCVVVWQKIDESKGLNWLQCHLDYCTSPLLSEQWVLNMDSPVKTLYAHQEGDEIGYNPAKPGLPSHTYHTYILSSLRLVLRLDVLPGDKYNVAHATDGLWSLLDHLGPTRCPALLRGGKSWGIERVMSRAEQNDLKNLFRLRITANVKRDLVRAMQHNDWADAGPGVARQGNIVATTWLEPAPPYRLAAPQTGARRRHQRPHRAWANTAELRRGRTRQGAVGIRRSGHVAE